MLTMMHYSAQNKSPTNKRPQNMSDGVKDMKDYE